MESSWPGIAVLYAVMPGLVPGIHVLTAVQNSKTWMAGTSPAMTNWVCPAMTRFLAGMTVEGFIAGQTIPFNEPQRAPTCSAPRQRE
jgi:hypothetical protein